MTELVGRTDTRSATWALLLLVGGCSPTETGADGTGSLTTTDTDGSGTTGEPPPCEHVYFREPEHQLSLYSTAFDIELGDLDGDGLLDAVVPIENGGTALLRNKGERNPVVGIFDVPVELAPSGRSGVAVADWSGDGLPDILTASISLFRTAPDSDGLWAEMTDEDRDTGEHVAEGVALVDMDNDGRLNAVAYTASQVFIWPGPDENGQLGQPWSTPVLDMGYGIRRGVVEDLDDDGFPDVVVATYSDSYVLVFRSDRSGQVLEPDVYSGTFWGLETHIVDLDMDDANDVIVVGSRVVEPLMPTGQAFVAWLRNTGDGTLEEASVIELTPGWLGWSVTHADIDDDGDPEVLVLAGGDTLEGKETGGIHFLGLEDGALTAVSPGFIETGVTWAPMTVSDVDDDGLLDIVTAPGGVTVLWGCRES